MTTRKISTVLVSCLGFVLVAAPVFAADAPAKSDAPAKPAADAKKPAADAKKPAADAKAAAGSSAAAAKPAAKDPNAPAMPANLSDSPYATGAPAITGGFTDTSQGGTKGSGDPLAVPPGVRPGGAQAPAGK